jgi:ABC-type transporter Mla maintaining outer membrane lipid asymmetry ATPase subunit MlaF
VSAVLGYEPLPGEDRAERIWLAAPGTHSVCTGCKAELLDAIHELRPREGARLFVLGADVGLLPEAERVALLGRVGFVPAGGGLISSLNAWENITLPVSYHQPRRIPHLHDEVNQALEQLGGVDDDLLGKLPEEMTLYEKRLCAYLRALLEKPRLLVVETLVSGLGPTKRRRTARFAATYHEHCPGGTYVTLEE